MNEEQNQINGQNEQAARVARLVAGYITGTLTEAEKDELDEWVVASDDNMRLFGELTDEKNIAKGLKERGMYNADQAVAKLMSRVHAKDNAGDAKTVRMFAVAAAACAVIAAAIFLLAPQFTTNEKPAITKAAPLVNDAAPGSSKAILSTAGGRQLLLDGTEERVLNADGMELKTGNGQLVYEQQPLSLSYHTLTVPRGGQFQLVLPDGSKAWLNAASSITYPTAFAGKERRVNITGEVYFDVAHDAAKPFHVDVNGMDVEVLGTAFNVNAYTEEEEMTTTLVRGSVKVTMAGRSAVIKPGEQAAVKEDKIAVSKVEELQAVTAWKDGEFEFRDLLIKDVMKQVARWYNVEVRYEGLNPYHFNARIPRNVPLSKLLHYLQGTDNVHFTIEDKTVIVKP